MFSGIPLPKTVYDTEKGGGFVTALSGQNALTTQNMNNRLLHAQGNLAQQQSNYTPYQYATQALANPSLWQTPAGIEAGKSIVAQLPALARQGIGNGNNSLQQLDQPSIGDRLINGIFSKMGLGNATNTSVGQGSQSPSQPAGNAIASMPAPNDSGNALAPPSQAGAGIPNPQGETSPLPSTQVNRLGRGQPLAGVNPSTIAGAAGKALDTGATHEAAEQEKQWSAKQEKAFQDADATVSNDRLMDKLEESHKNLMSIERGPVGGRLLPVSNAANTFDKTTEALANGVAIAQVDGHVSDSARKAFKEIKFDRAQPHQSFKELLAFNRGMNARIQEYPAFLQSAREHGLNTSQADSVWTYYGQKAPFYNPKTGTQNDGENGRPDNIGSWEKFLTPEKFAEAMSPSAQKSIRKEHEESEKTKDELTEKGISFSKIEPGDKMYRDTGGSTNQPVDDENKTIIAKENSGAGMSPPNDSVWMRAPDGSQQLVHRDNIERAKKESKFELIG